MALASDNAVLEISEGEPILGPHQVTQFMRRAAGNLGSPGRPHRLIPKSSDRSHRQQSTAETLGPADALPQAMLESLSIGYTELSIKLGRDQGDFAVPMSELLLTALGNNTG